MATYILLIDRNVPQHWEYAKTNGFWDVQKNWQGLDEGDTAYFWVTGNPGRVVGRARLISGKEPLRPDEPHAWSPEDTRRGNYRYRVHLTDFEDIPNGELR